MDRWILVLISALFVQGLYAAAVDISANTLNGAPLNSLSNLTPEDAKVLAELQRLRTSGERFQQEAMTFIQSLPNRLSDGFSQSHQLFKLLSEMFSSAVNEQIGPLVENIEAGRKLVTENVNRIATEGLRRGQEGLAAGVNLGRNTLDGIRKNGNAIIQNGISYLHPSNSAQLQTRSLINANPLNADKHAAQQLTTERLLTASPEELDESDEFDEDVSHNPHGLEEEDEDYLEEESNQGLMTRDDKPVTTVLSEQIGQVGTASTEAIKNVAQFTSGGLRGLLDALSSVLITTSDVGSHARKAISGINQSGARTVSSVIDTSGNLFSGVLDKTGSIVDSMKLGGSVPNVPAGGPKK